MTAHHQNQPANAFILQLDEEFTYDIANGHNRVFQNGNLIEQGQFVGSKMLISAAFEIKELRSKHSELETLLNKHSVYLEPLRDEQAVQDYDTVDVEARKYQIVLDRTGSAAHAVTHYGADAIALPVPVFFEAVAHQLHNARRRVAYVVGHLLEHGIGFNLDLRK